ncbi:hypothetical protein LTR33_017165, partial [Friedmanniomyces endolithicus]
IAAWEAKRNLLEWKRRDRFGDHRPTSVRPDTVNARRHPACGQGIVTFPGNSGGYIGTGPTQAACDEVCASSIFTPCFLAHLRYATAY